MTYSSFGQGALRQLPAHASEPMRPVSNYTLPPELRSERKTLVGSKHTGVEVYKVAKNGKLQPRRIAISPDNRSIIITSNKIKSIKKLFRAAVQTQELTVRVISLDNVERIERGQESNRFIAAKSTNKFSALGDANNNKHGTTNNCLSILHRVTTREAASFTEGLLLASNRGPHRFESLDLYVPSNNYDLLCSTLEDILDLYHEERKFSNHYNLFLQHHWIDLGKELGTTMSASEWMALCDRANLPMKKPIIQKYWNEFCQDSDDRMEEGLTLSETAELLAELREYLQRDEHPLVQVWNDLVESDPVPAVKYDQEKQDHDLELQLNAQEESISAVAFLSFVRSQQREFSKSLEHVQNLMRLINKQTLLEEDETKEDLLLSGGQTMETLSPTERLSKTRFLSYLLSDVNDIMDPAQAVLGADDMDQPLSHYWINTSHDTYLAKLPNAFRFKKDLDYEGYHTVEPQTYIYALYRGVRCLELDVFDGLYDTPVVARRKPANPSDNQSLLFSQVLQSIRLFLQQNPDSYPILLFLENHCSIQNQVIMAKDLENILGDKLFRPKQNKNIGQPLPSPSALVGKVLVKSKLPSTIRDGATVLNDDFDEEHNLPLERHDDALEIEDDDDEEDEDDIQEKLGFVVRFEADGPIRSKEPHVVKYSAAALLHTARQEAIKARQEADRVEAKEKELALDASEAEALAQSLISQAGLGMSQVISRASKADQDYARGVENIYSNSLEDEFVGKINHQHFTNIAGEGLEVQDFFGNAVEGAKSEFSEADIAARAAAEVTTLALERLSEADHALTDAEARLEESYHLEKEKALEARRAANEARANREHADTARRRVETVKELLRNSKDRATSAEAVVVTAVTEAKISEQRAGEMEARASRALAIAEKERTRADVETRKEEVLEQEASELHDRSTQATKEAKAARDRMEKAASMLDKVNEQIKLIEQSTQFQKDMKEWDKTRDMDAFNSEAGFPKHGGNVLAKHAAKLQERQVCTEVLKEASVAYQSVDVRRKRIQTALEEKAHMWKMQSEIASQARKQADRSSQHAEELAEHAEEEREAASLRHIARERAQQSVSKTDNYQSSIQAQLIEASRASEEAASLALESRIKAEKLEREAEFFKDHSEAIKHVENMKKKWEEADAAYQAALKKKKTADEKAKNAKRLFDTSSEVLTRAQRDSANEINDANMRRQMEREAVQAYRNMIICQKLVSNASQKTKMAKDAALQKSAAERRAREYKIKMDSRGSVAPELARLTFLHSDKFQKWEKSHALPSFHLHSIAHVRVSQMLEKNGEKERDNFVAFTRNHLCRTFPSWRLVRERKEVNYDPTTAHALGCQLVSMNLHSSDEHLLVNDGRFRANGSCGYVLKPAELLEDVPQRAQTWRFTVLCGSCLPKSEVAMTRKSIPVPVGGSIHPISPFVRVALYDGAIGEEVILHETKPVHKNGFSPVWNDEEDEFDFKVTNPSIAVLLFTVWDDDTSDFVAGAAVPVDSIRQGYRSVSLFDSLHSRCGPYAYASIVVRAQQM